MNKDKIYIGVYEKNNQESLFYQKDIDIFYDLKQEKKVSSDEIEEDSLVPYNDIINCKSKLKRNIIKLYDLDRMQKVSLDRVYIGNIYQITKIISQDYHGDSIWNFGVNSKFRVDLQNKDILLLALSRNIENADFRTIETGVLYKKSLIPEYGDFYISCEPENLKLASIELSISGKEIEKGKLLEKYRDYKWR